MTQATSQELLRSFNISDDDLQKMVADAVFFLLTADQKKSIISKAALVKACDLSKRDRKLQDYVIKCGAQHLSNTFGIELRDLGKSTFILVNKLSENDVNEFLQWDDKEAAQMGLTFTILGLILMHNDKVTEENLFDFLKGMGVYDEDKRNNVDNEVLDMFDGDMRRFVNETLVSKQHYLRKERNIHIEDSEQFEYSWGERADAEIKQSLVFKMICEVFGCDPKMFKEQYERIKEKENLTDEEFMNGA